MKASDKKSTLSIFWQKAKKYKISLFLILLSQAIMVIGGFILIPLFLKYFFDVLTNFQGLDRSTAFSELFQFWIIVTVLDVVTYSGFGRISDFSLTFFATKVSSDLAHFCFEKIHQHSFDFFTNNFVGSLVTKTNRFVYGFQGILNILLFNFFPNIIRFIFCIGVIFYFAPWIGSVVGIWILIYFAVVYWATKKWKIPKSLAASSEQSKYTGALADSITNANSIKIFAQYNFENYRFQKFVKNFTNARKKSWNTSNYLNIFQAIFMSILEGIVLLMIIQFWIKGTLSVGTIVMIQSYTMGIYTNLWDIGRIIRDYYETLADCQEMTDIINQIPDILDPPQAQKCKILKGEIEFQNVKFSYEKKNKGIFQKFNFHIFSGEKIGVVGKSGAGKTTITKLLLRFADIDSGDILIDHQSIYKLTQNDLRQSISFVPQDPILFHRTLFENIQYGNLKATKAEVISAAKKAHAHEFIMHTPEKYETFVGERGIKLSGGERQRIAIARSILKNSPSLILDEATSSLDSQSEKFIQEALHTLMKDRTTIVIAHRLSTLKKMDKICVIEKGKIVEFDTHENLLKKKGKYADLWNHQVGGFLLDDDSKKKEEINLSLASLEQSIEE